MIDATATIATVADIADIAEVAACLGIGQTKKFREWIAQGGGPPRPDDLDDKKAELDWLKWLVSASARRSAFGW
jgi:hypothetical protein